MKRGFLGVVVLATLSNAALAQNFDINAYCRSLADAVDGSNIIELVCRGQETEAKRALTALQTSPRTFKYCTDVARAVGGSYLILKICVEQENAAAK